MDFPEDSQWNLGVFKGNLLEELHNITSFIEKRRLLGIQVFPPENLIFEAWKCTNPCSIKVVILGQDPYHRPGQANGLAFSVNRDVNIPPSLKNIFAEIRREYPDSVHLHGDLHAWAEQGVFLMNTLLSVEEGLPLSHNYKAWELLSCETIKYLNLQKNPIVFMLWGAKAQGYESLINSEKHLILKSSHPSPLSVYRGFSGCGHFKAANRFLKEQNNKEIDWSIR